MGDNYFIIINNMLHFNYPNAQRFIGSSMLNSEELTLQ